MRWFDLNKNKYHICLEFISEFLLRVDADQFTLDGYENDFIRK